MKYCESNVLGFELVILQLTLCMLIAIFHDLGKKNE